MRASTQCVGAVMLEFDEQLKATLKRLEDVPEKMQALVLRGALRAAAKPILQVAKDRAPTATGTLKKSVRFSAKRDRKLNAITASIKAGGGNAWYASIVEFGAQPHEITIKDEQGRERTLKHPGMRALPYMRPAFDGAGQESMVAFGEYIRKRLDKAGF